MNVTKEHAGLYILRDASHALIGQVMNGQHGWTYRNNKGFGPRQPSVSAARALTLAVITKHLSATNLEKPWSDYLVAADVKFNHNHRIASATAR